MVSNSNLRCKAHASPVTVARRLCLLLLFACIPATAHIDSAPSKILCRPELADTRRQELAERLREITGWRKLHFDESGVLSFGATRAAGGSPTARALLEKAAAGDNLLVIEDASDCPEVVFSRVIEGRWTSRANGESALPPVYIAQVDFTDFSRVKGDPEALAAFNTGWALLHEISHVVNDAADTERAGETGACEELINTMRRECDLAERAEYHFHFLPGFGRSEFKTKLVRLAFEQHEPATNRKRRLWLMWDADLVGGLSRPQR